MLTFDYIMIPLVIASFLVMVGLTVCVVLTYRVQMIVFTTIWIAAAAIHVSATACFLDYSKLKLETSVGVFFLMLFFVAFVAECVVIVGSYVTNFVPPSDSSAPDVSAKEKATAAN